MAFQHKKEVVGRRAAWPGFVEPCLARTIEKVPGGERWLHQINSMAIAYRSISRMTTRVFTRRDHDSTNRFRKIANDAWSIKADDAIIDGEVVVPAENGTTDFSVLQNELRGGSKKILSPSIFSI